MAMFGQFDALFLARIQFAFTISFHFIFPAFSIGLEAGFLGVIAGWETTEVGRQPYTVYGLLCTADS